MDNLATRWLPIVRQMADTDESFRFAVLIGSYARKETPADKPADPWSDLDLVTAFDDPDRMFADTSWLEAFGEAKIVFSQGLPVYHGRECRALFADGAGTDTWHQARFFERWVAEEDLCDLKHAYAHYDVPDMDAALERTMDLFARVGREVAALLSVPYPDEAECFARTHRASDIVTESNRHREIIRPFREMGVTKPYNCREDVPLQPVIRSMYICVKDMNRAVAFYQEFLESTPIEKDEIYTVFDVGGFRLGLFAYGKMGEAHTFGDNCLPSIEVESEDRFLAKLQSVEVVYGPKPIGCFLVAEFLDSEGNRLELTTRKESAG